MVGFVELFSSEAGWLVEGVSGRGIIVSEVEDSSVVV